MRSTALTVYRVLEYSHRTADYEDEYGYYDPHGFRLQDAALAISVVTC